jgi:hypothetical protein
LFFFCSPASSTPAARDKGILCAHPDSPNKSLAFWVHPDYSPNNLFYTTTFFLATSFPTALPLEHLLIFVSTFQFEHQSTHPEHLPQQQGTSPPRGLVVGLRLPHSDLSSKSTLRLGLEIHKSTKLHSPLSTFVFCLHSPLSAFCFFFHREIFGSAPQLPRAISQHGAGSGVCWGDPGEGALRGLSQNQEKKLGAGSPLPVTHGNGAPCAGSRTGPPDPQEKALDPDLGLRVDPKGSLATAWGQVRACGDRRRPAGPVPKLGAGSPLPVTHGNGAPCAQLFVLDPPASHDPRVLTNRARM